ncbi:alpha/beta hydrolase [Azoarcus sp. TTM-91]|uniref:alpha/beta hydrolase n=1 Tax=Azoarcus sp. TTM-91 TaxID=2691581 RepID=UPI00145F56B7|nr:alpha/beta fold hydrolase [Azoarcus sp. TTM-91]NMG35933.1 alpha/beta hydrolase [Azoarcus sp. TTM-91]
MSTEPSRNPPTESVLLRGAEGNIDVLIDAPAEVRGIALVCHPHPLFSGSNTNKVAHTLARAYRDLGYAALRPNFRGVGKSEGTHDHGDGETEDMLAVIAWAQSRWGSLPLALGGFSFGAFVQTRVVNRLADGVAPPRQIVLVGTAAGVASHGQRSYDTQALPKGIPALLIHGEADDTVPLANVFEWARPQELPVTVIPGADHFFHAKLHILRDIILRNVPALG